MPQTTQHLSAHESNGGSTHSIPTLICHTVVFIGILLGEKICTHLHL